MPDVRCESILPSMEFIGETAAIATALCWSFTFVFFAEAGKLIGSFKVNKIRLLFAVIIYGLVLLVTTGCILPEYITLEHVLWLGLSGIVGLVIGDGAGFKAMVILGPRLTALLYSSAPVMTTIIAWLFLGEALNVLDLGGITVTLLGISWVVSERKYQSHNRRLHQGHPDAGSRGKGVAFGLIAALGQAVGLVLAKHAMLNLGTAVEPMEASFIRMLTSMIVIWSISIFRGRLRETVSAMKNPKAISNILGGTVFGPFLGVWMSLVAVSYIAAGIAATLNSTTPIMIIPIVKFIYREKVTLRAVLGAAVTVLGVTILFVS